MNKKYNFYNLAISTYILAVIVFLFTIFVLGKNNKVLGVNLLFSIIQIVWCGWIISKNNNSKVGLFNLILPYGIFNLAFLLISQLHGFDNLFRPTDFRVGFPFGNYMDFYSAIVYSFNLDGIKLLFQTGYYPFSIILARIIGYSMGLTENNLNFAGYFPFIIYNLIFVACIYPLFIYIKNTIKLKKLTYYVFLFIVATSYPMIFLYERGNLVLLSILFLSLSLIYEKKYPKLFPLFVALLVSIKLLNIIFILLLWDKPRIDKIKAAIFVLIIQVLSLFILYLLQSDLNLSFNDAKALLFNATIKPSYVFSDSIKIFATSGFDSLRLSIIYLKGGLFADGGIPVNIKIFYILPSIILILIYSIILFYRKTFNNKLLIIFIYITLALFHPTFADYSLALLLPLIVFLLDNFNKNRKLIGLLLLLFLSIGIFPIMEVQCCGGQLIPGRVVFLTIKSFIFPMVYLLIIFELFKNINYSNN